jgi:hypothetical protein
MGSGLISMSTGGCGALHDEKTYVVNATGWIWLDEDFCKDQKYNDFGLGNILIFKCSTLTF